MYEKVNKHTSENKSLKHFNTARKEILLLVLKLVLRRIMKSLNIAFRKCLSNWIVDLYRGTKYYFKLLHHNLIFWWFWLKTRSHLFDITKLNVITCYVRTFFILWLRKKYFRHWNKKKKKTYYSEPNYIVVFVSTALEIAYI